MKEIEVLAGEIADYLAVNPASVNLSRISKGWRADVFYQGDYIESDDLDPIEAMRNLLFLTERQINGSCHE